MHYKRKTPSSHRERLEVIFVKMLAEPLNELHDNSEHCEFHRFVLSELAARDGV